jgi:hypothetical protein
MEGLFEMLMEQHSNEPSLSSVVLDWLRYVQEQPVLWEKVVMEIDPNDPAAASDFLAGVLQAAEFDETFIPIHILIVALHNAIGCSAKDPRLSIPCTRYQFKIIKSGDNYALGFVAEKCEHVSGGTPKE